jgi:hypothetical protein
MASSKKSRKLRLIKSTLWMFLLPKYHNRDTSHKHKSASHSLMGLQ